MWEGAVGTHCCYLLFVLNDINDLIVQCCNIVGFYQPTINAILDLHLGATATSGQHRATNGERFGNGKAIDFKYIPWMNHDMHIFDD